MDSSEWSELARRARGRLGSRSLILASASPRRHQLLGDTGLEFSIQPADADETIDLTLDAGAVAEDLALRKARLVSAAQGNGTTVVLGSDTVVVLGGDGDPERRFLEKAADEKEAAWMLRSLSATRHRVITGVAAVWREAGGTALERADHEVTWVSMRAIEPAEIGAYVASGEWRGKAGGYAIQETADRFVSGLEGGGFDNVVGLPVARTLALLAAGPE